MMYVYFFGIAFVQRIQNRNESNGEGKMFYNIRRKKQWPECGTHIHSLLFRVSCCCCWFFFYYSVYWNFQWTVSLASIFLFGLLFAGTFNAVLSNANVESKSISILYICFSFDRYAHRQSYIVIHFGIENCKLNAEPQQFLFNALILQTFSHFYTYIERHLEHTLTYTIWTKERKKYGYFLEIKTP